MTLAMLAATVMMTVVMEVVVTEAVGLDPAPWTGVGVGIGIGIGTGLGETGALMTPLGSSEDVQKRLWLKLYRG